MKKKYLAVLLAMLCLLCGCSKKAETENEQPADDQTTTTEIPAAGNTEATVTEVVEIVVKDYGTITVELYGEVAPKTVDNFVTLVKDGFYDGLTFHRIIAGFMMQGGDPKGNGTGGSGENIEGEFEANGFENNISHTRGTISMARAGDPNSASSQFFIMHEDYTGLDGQYAAFGRVTEGIDVVDAICTDAKPVDNNGSIAREAQPVIESITIIELN